MLAFEEFSLVLMVSVAYGYVYSLFPKDAFGFSSRIDPYYFSFTIMSTVGFGDLTPRTAAAKLVVMTQQAVLMTGVLALLSTTLAASSAARTEL